MEQAPLTQPLYSVT